MKNRPENPQTPPREKQPEKAPKRQGEPDKNRQEKENW